MGFGVVDVHNHIIESKETVVRRIIGVLPYIPKEQLWIDPDCGLKTRTVEEAINKLKIVVEATHEVRRGAK